MSRNQDNQANHVNQGSDNVPILRFQEFSDKWKSSKFKDICVIVGGGTPDTKIAEYWDGEYLWFTPSEVGEKYISKSKRTITKIGLTQSSAKLLPKGTLLFSSRATIGEISIALLECTTNQGFQSMIVNKKYYNEFIYYWVKNNVNLFIEKASGSTFLEISKSNIQKISLLVPSLPEQQKIASFLTTVDEKLQSLKKKKTLLEQYKKGVMQKIFSQEIRFRDDNGKEYPEWEEKPFHECINTIPSKKYQIKSTEIYSFGKYKVIDQGQDLIAGYSNEEKFLFKDVPVIVFGDHTTILKYIDFSFIVGADGTKLLKNDDDNNIKYLYYNLNYNNVQQEGYKRHFSILSDKTLQKPCIQEQTKIANFLSAIDDKINHCQTQIDTTEMWKKGLLQRMFC